MKLTSLSAKTNEEKKTLSLDAVRHCHRYY